MKYINLDTGCIRVNLPSNISVSVYLHQPPLAQSLLLTSILSSCAPRCSRGECRMTLMRWKMKYQRHTEEYERQEMCLGIYHFDRLCSFSEPAHSLWARGKQVMMLPHCGKPCRIALTPFVLHQFCCLNAATHWSWAHLISRAKFPPFSPLNPRRVSTQRCAAFPQSLAAAETSMGSPCPDWLNRPPSSPPSRGLLVFLFLIHSTASNFEKLHFTFYFLTLPLFCNALHWHCSLHHISHTVLVFFVICILHRSCHLENLILLRSIQTNLWVRKNGWENKSE